MNEEFEKWWNKTGGDLISPNSLDQEHFIAEAAWNAAIDSRKVVVHDEVENA